MLRVSNSVLYTLERKIFVCLEFTLRDSYYSSDVSMKILNQNYFRMRMLDRPVCRPDDHSRNLIKPMIAKYSNEKKYSNCVPNFDIEN